MSAIKKQTPTLEYHKFTYIDEKRRKKDRVLYVQSKIGLTRELLKNAFKLADIYNEEDNKILQREIKYKLKLEEHLSTLTEKKAQRTKTKNEQQRTVLKMVLKTKSSDPVTDSMQEAQERSKMRGSIQWSTKAMLTQQNCSITPWQTSSGTKQKSKIPLKQKVETWHHNQQLPLTSASLTQLDLQLQNLMTLKFYLGRERPENTSAQNVELGAEKSYRLTEWLRQQNEWHTDVRPTQLGNLKAYAAEKQEEIPAVQVQQTFSARKYRLAEWIRLQNEKRGQWQRLSIASNWFELQRV